MKSCLSRIPQVEGTHHAPSATCCRESDPLPRPFHRWAALQRISREKIDSYISRSNSSDLRISNKQLHSSPELLKSSMASYDFTNRQSRPVGQLVDKANPFNEVSCNVQTASTRSGFPSSMFQHQTPNSYGGNTSTKAWGRPSGGTYDTSTNRWSRSGDVTYRSGTDGWSKLHGGTYDTGSNGCSSGDGTYDVNNGWGKPNHVSRATPTSYEIPPTKTTNDVDSAVDYLRESISHQSITVAPRQGRFSASSPTYPTRETVLEMIDSREASRRYGNSTASPQTIQEIYSTTIDSREAARKYRGSFV